MADVTIVIPFSPAHSMIVERAIASARLQTAACEIVVYRDSEQRGAGYARNRGLERVTTPLVTFLDADDTIAPNFIETCLAVLKPNHYVYTDWHDGAGHYGRAPSPCKVWTEKTFHLVTTLMRVEDVTRIGGFDEALTGAEDTDFGLRLRLSGVCGVHVAQALVLYQPGGTRSNTLRNSPADMQIQQYFTKRYGDYKLMGCCGADTEVTLPLNEKQAGDVLMIAAWAGNHPFTGHATGRRYGDRVGNFRAFWVDPQDVAAQPSLWRKPSEQDVQRTVLQPGYQAVPPDIDWQNTMNTVFGGGQPQAPSQPVEYKPHVAGRSKKAVIEQAQK